MNPDRRRPSGPIGPLGRRLERGLTLAEILVVSAVVATSVGGLTMVLVDAGGRVWTRTDGQLTTLSHAQSALDRLTQDLYTARQPVTCSAGGSLSFTKLVRNAATQQLIAGPVVTYSCVGCSSTAPGTLTKVEGTGAPQVMASGLTGFTSTCLSEGLVRITLTSRVNTGQGAFTPTCDPSAWTNPCYTLESQVWVRNPGGS